MTDIPLKRCSRGDKCKHPEGPFLPETDDYFFRRADAYSHQFRPTCKVCTHWKRQEKALKRAKDSELDASLKATIDCALCGLECSMQVPASHLRIAHNMTTEEYRALGYETLSPARLEQLRKTPVAQGKQRRLCGTDHPLYKGGSITSSGYREIFVDGKRILEHRYVAAQKIGRPFRKGEIVHHIDGNKLNNHPDNLQVMMQSEHNQLDANCKKMWHIYPETEEAAKLLHSLGWSKAKIARAMRVEWGTVARWLKRY